MARDLNAFRTQLARSCWQTESGLLPSAVAEWVLHTDSLTEKLQSICQQFRVALIHQGWQAVDFGEKSAKQWVREVVLKCGETDWIFAQTILPQETIENVAREVLTLGEQPIGLWLFPQKPQRLSLMWQQSPETGSYARRSQLLLRGYPLEIKELFLADFPFGASPQLFPSDSEKFDLDKFSL